MDDILDKCPDPFIMAEVSGRAEEKTPFVIVALQECERTNTLLVEIRRSLKELDLGLKVFNLYCIKLLLTVTQNSILLFRVN